MTLQTSTLPFMDPGIIADHFDAVTLDDAVAEHKAALLKAKEDAAKAAERKIQAAAAKHRAAAISGGQQQPRGEIASAAFGKLQSERGKVGDGRRLLRWWRVQWRLARARAVAAKRRRRRYL